MTIYKVTTPTERRLVKAVSRAQAINHVVKPGVEAIPVTPDELLSLIQEGVTVEDSAPELPLAAATAA